MGSSIFVWIESNLRIYDSIFRQDNAYLANILLVSYSDDGVIRKPSNLTVKNCTFEKNTVFSNGVIYLDELGCGEIIDSAFIENNVSHCGSLILDACYQALVKNCLFTRNTGAHGAAIHVKVFNSNYRSNVTIEDCNFTKNTAEYSGGAVYSKYGIVNIKNCKFTENMANNCGGAVFTKLSSIDIDNSLFEKNTGTDGGAVFTKDGAMSIENSDFKYNQATGKGGAVYSRNRTISYASCTFKSNTAPKGADIYGEYTAEITQTGKYYSDVNLEIRLSSKLNDYLSQKVKVKFTGPTNYTAKWFKTDRNGVLKLKVPKNLKVGKYTVKITLESGICYTKTMTVKVIKAPCKASVKKVKTTYKSGKKLKITLKNKKTGKKVIGAEITLKLSNGKKYSLKTDEKGTATFDTSKLKAGKYSVTISAKDKNIKLKKTRTSIEIKKAKAKISFTKKVKKSGKINITVLNKKSGKAIKNSFKVKVQNGKTYKTLKVKTNKKGVLKINTAGLKKGKHSIEIILKSKNYNIAEKIRVKII